MIPNYTRFVLRYFYLNRLYSLLNMTGLTVGIGCFILIALYVRSELSYDQFNKQASRIMLVQQFEGGPTTGGKLATGMHGYFAGVETTLRLKNSNPLIGYRERAYYEKNFYFADSTVFDVFTFPLLLGNPNTALKENHGVIISEKMADKYFPHQNPLGREIVYDRKHKLHVTGVLKNLPVNSSLQIDFLAPYADANELMGWDVSNNYWAGSTLTFLLLSPGAKAADVERRFPLFLKTLNDPNAAFVWKLHLIPLLDLYLAPPFSVSKPITYVYIFSIIGVFILALACFNYINLATARAPSRAKEVGVRKVLGSSAGKLRVQFMGETAFFIALSMVAALALLQMGMSGFNSITQKDLSLAPLFSVTGIGLMLAGIGLVCLLAGAYPAFILASYRAAAVLKGEARHGRKKAWFRKVLVVTQFSVSMAMIVATIIIISQLRYLQHKDLGYQRSQVLTLDLHDAAASDKTRFKQQVTHLSGVLSATIAYGLPGSDMTIGGKLIRECVPPGADGASMDRLTIDEDYLKTFDIKLLEGRAFDPTRPADAKTFLINEAAKKYFGWKDIKGKQTGYYTFSDRPDGSYAEIPQRGDVIGVIGDYNHADLKTPIKPMIISLNEGNEGEMAVKLEAGDLSATIGHIQALWKQDFPGTPFAFQFMDETFNRTYQAEVRTGQLSGMFAMLAILISCLGLFGLAAFAAERRNKEIGIRKVLGASIAQIVGLLSKDFTVLIVLATLIAFPLATYVMQRWLQGFAYRVPIHWWVFAVTGGLVILMVMVTVGFQTLKAALSNPVNSLRAE